MDVKFALYDKATGNVLLMLPDEPDNSDYLDTGIVEYGSIRMAGVKWDNVGVWANDDGVELDITHRWRYDEANEEFIDLGKEELP